MTEFVKSRKVSELKKKASSTSILFWHFIRLGAWLLNTPSDRNTSRLRFSKPISRSTR